MRRWSPCSGTPVILSPDSTKVGALRALRPNVSFLGEPSDENRLVMPEPLGDLPCARKAAEISWIVLQPGGGGFPHFRPECADGPGPWG